MNVLIIEFKNYLLRRLTRNSPRSSQRKRLHFPYWIELPVALSYLAFQFLKTRTLKYLSLSILYMNLAAEWLERNILNLILKIKTLSKIIIQQAHKFAASAKVFLSETIPAAVNKVAESTSTLAGTIENKITPRLQRVKNFLHLVYKKMSRLVSKIISWAVTETEWSVSLLVLIITLSLLGSYYYTNYYLVEQARLRELELLSQQQEEITEEPEEEKFVQTQEVHTYPVEITQNIQNKIVRYLFEENKYMLQRTKVNTSTAQYIFYYEGLIKLYKTDKQAVEELNSDMTKLLAYINSLWTEYGYIESIDIVVIDPAKPEQIVVNYNNTSSDVESESAIITTMYDKQMKFRRGDDITKWAVIDGFTQREVVEYLMENNIKF